ncbi:MAG TPA: glycerophosphodiester phosphodiesterase family protein [Allosphingosinicella sp.]|nr:glycerophosphodiester phosphodiesterase family protein [Allosphingosinicella sp.]
MTKSKYSLIALAFACVVLTLLNASWLAGKPEGALVLIAHRGVIQPTDRAAAGDGCDARHVVAGRSSNLIENSAGSMQNAIFHGAGGLMLDVQASADGRAMIFRDRNLECRTNGTGALAQRDAAYLQSLDIGHGYSADGGRTFPLRGNGVGGMPTAEDVLQAFPRAVLIFDLADARAADATVAAFARAGVAIGASHGFAGPPEALARLRRLTPAGWTVDPQASEACLSGYRLSGWLGIVPGNCSGATLILPRGGGWTLWGWPYRFHARMTGAGARMLVTGDREEGGPLAGLTEPEQLGEVPHDYTGLLLIEDMRNVGRALVR